MSSNLILNSIINNLNNKIMCLYKNRMYHRYNRPLIADEDIVCYKFLEKSATNIYTTPFTFDVIPIECIEDKVPFNAEILHICKFIWKHIFGFGYIVEDGFIHSYNCEPSPHPVYVTFKCIIPKGTKYFVGSLNDYASEKIIFLEEIKPL